MGCHPQIQMPGRRGPWRRHRQFLSRRWEVVSRQRRKCQPQPRRLVFMVGPKAYQLQPSRCHPIPLILWALTGPAGSLVLGSLIRRVLLDALHCLDAVGLCSRSDRLIHFLHSTPKEGEALVLLPSRSGAKMPACRSLSILGKFRHATRRGSEPKEKMGRGLAGTGRPGRVPGKRFLRSELWCSALAQNSSCFPPPPQQAVRFSPHSLVLSPGL